jgi:hypothetical protein
MSKVKPGVSYTILQRDHDFSLVNTHVTQLLKGRVLYLNKDTFEGLNAANVVFTYLNFPNCAEEVITTTNSGEFVSDAFPVMKNNVVNELKMFVNGEYVKTVTYGGIERVEEKDIGDVIVQVDMYEEGLKGKFDFSFNANVIDSITTKTISNVTVNVFEGDVYFPNAYINVQKYNYQKLNSEYLIATTQTNENGVFFLNDPNIISNDYQKQRALDNYNKRALRTSASSVACKGNNSDKPEVEKYYKKYVDNYKEPDNNNNKLRSSRSMPRNNYNEELNKQIEDKNRLRNKRDQEEQERMNNEQRKDYEKFLNKQNEENKKRQRMNEDFIQGNKNLIYLKNKKKENEINKTYEDDYKKALNVQKQLEDEIIKKKNEDNKKKMELQKELEKQMKEKEIRKAIEKEEYKCVPNSNSGCCTCQGRGVCSQCKKTYPLNFLNTKKNYKSLAQARYERKKSNKNNIKY